MRYEITYVGNLPKKTFGDGDRHPFIDFPKGKIVVLSPDDYDHLQKGFIRQIINQTPNHPRFRQKEVETGAVREVSVAKVEVKSTKAKKPNDYVKIDKPKPKDKEKSKAYVFPRFPPKGKTSHVKTVVKVKAVKKAKANKRKKD